LSVHTIEGRLNVFDFFSVYCPPCMKLSPSLHTLAAASTEVNIVKIDINRPDIKGIYWKSPVSKQFRFKSIPYFIVVQPDGTRLEGESARDFVIPILAAHPPYMDSLPACVKNLRLLEQAMMELKIARPGVKPKEISLDDLKQYLPGGTLPNCPAMEEQQNYKLSYGFLKCPMHGSLNSISKNSCIVNMKNLTQTIKEIRNAPGHTGEINAQLLKSHLPGQVFPSCDTMLSGESYLIIDGEIACPHHGTLTEDRYYSIDKLIKTAYLAGLSAEVLAMCPEQLSLAERFGPKNWNYGNAVFNANHYQGLLAFDRGDFKTACEFLIKSGEAPASPQLESYGPDLSLARKLAQSHPEQVKLFLRKITNYWSDCPSYEKLIEKMK
ncbi:MAG: thioredoxin family protein, partial [Candidatus Wallbacteria bacterium]|nr:thioredoxin family protein [Candidatus Wallbacteria bacterium]